MYSSQNQFIGFHEDFAQLIALDGASRFTLIGEGVLGRAWQELGAKALGRLGSEPRGTLGTLRNGSQNQYETGR